MRDYMSIKTLTLQRKRISSLTNLKRTKINLKKMILIIVVTLQSQKVDRLRSPMATHTAVKDRLIFTI